MVRDLEAIIYEYPNAIEAKAFLAVWIWQSAREGLPINSHGAVTSLIEDVLDVEPMHPCHHFRIHLWDNEKPARALASAARCGQGSSGIAHMWHMPGHIYSKLKRYHDSAWQQEASARVDHAHMMRDRVLPDQIHNFAHNNEWLTRNLNHLGRANDAVALARNMIELPRHPKYNSLAKPDAPTEYGKRGSARYGRTRLLETLLRYEMWDEIISASQTVYLEKTTILEEQAKRLAAVGIARYALGQEEKGTEILAKLDELKQRLEDMKLEAGAKASADALNGEKNDKEAKKARTDAMKPFDGRIKTIDQFRAELLAYQAAADEDGKDWMYVDSRRAVHVSKFAPGTAEADLRAKIASELGGPEAVQGIGLDRGCTNVVSSDRAKLKAKGITNGALVGLKYPGFTREGKVRPAALPTLPPAPAV